MFCLEMGASGSSLSVQNLISGGTEGAEHLSPRDPRLLCRRNSPVSLIFLQTEANPPTQPLQVSWAGVQLCTNTQPELDASSEYLT